MGTVSKFSLELQERAVRLVSEQAKEHPSQWAAICSVAVKIGCTPETLRRWVRQSERDLGKAVGLTTDEQELLKQLQRENRELRRSNEILKAASFLFCEGGVRQPKEMMVDFVDQNGQSRGVEPICENLPIAPSTYYNSVAVRNDLQKKSALRRREDELRPHIQRLYDEGTRRYGARKVWRELKREGRAVARCDVERLMRQKGLVGVSRGRKSIRTTWSDPNNLTPEDLVQRDFHAERPNQLWEADFTYVATWSGWVFVAFIIDAFAKTIVDWRAATRMTADLTLDALEQAIWARSVNAGLVHTPLRPR